MSFARPLAAVLLVTLTFISIPSATLAATKFENPLLIGDPYLAIMFTITLAIQFLLSLAAVVALASLLYGGLRLLFGSTIGEAEVARAKQIIFWAIIGLLVIGMATAILRVLRYVLGLGTL